MEHLNKNLNILKHIHLIGKFSQTRYAATAELR